MDNDIKLQLQPVETNILTFNSNNPGWNQPFNKVSFANNDTVNSVWINGVEIPKGQQLIISLNEREYNTTQFAFDFRGSTTALLLIIYTRYSQLMPNEL